MASLVADVFLLVNVVAIKIIMTMVRYMNI